MAKKQHRPGKFKVKEDGVWHHNPPDDPEFVAPYIVKKASFIAADKKWHTQFQFKNTGGQVQTLELPRSDARNSKTLRDNLIDRGFDWPQVKSQEEVDLLKYLSSEPDHQIEWVAKTGWYKGTTFVFQDGAIGPEMANVKFKPMDDNSVSAGTRGDLATWKKIVSQVVPCSNSAMLALGTAFGGPFHQLLRIESGGFNLFGKKSKGKTTAAVAAQSVYGISGRDEVLTWDITETALDELRCEHSDMLAYLDDMGRAGDNDKDRIERIGDAAFRLTTGKPRRRSKGFKVDPNFPSSWLAILSTSVRSMLKISMNAGSHVFGGEEVRLIDVPAVASDELGIFDRCPEGYDNSRVASFTLETMCSQNYGVAGREYVRRIVEDQAAAVEYVKKRITAFIEAAGAAGDSEYRYVQRFALAYAGLRLAAKFGVITLQKEAAWKAIRSCYARARRSAPTFPIMLDNAVHALREALSEKKGILNLSRPGHKTTRAKFDSCSGILTRHTTGELIYAVKLEDLGTLCRSSLPVGQILQELKERNLMVLIDGGKSTIPVTIPGIKAKEFRPRLICILQRKLDLQKKRPSNAGDD
ncbi:MAG: DUF927 domain-containing protein [Rhodospirillaceae bacterium]